jgi:peptide/nickel transport system permease protein
MGRYVLRRIGHAIVALVAVSMIVFVASRLSGDPAVLMLREGGASRTELSQLQHVLGLDVPLHIQYWNFLRGALRGDFGYSFWQQQRVTVLISERLPATLQLALIALFLLVVLAFPVGIYAAVYRHRPSGVLLSILTSLGQSIPVFWAGPLLILVFAVWLRWLPPFGRGGLQHLILPALTLATFSSTRVARIVRSEVIDILDADYVRTARAKGLLNRTVLFKHVVRNALIPVVTIVGMEFGQMLGGAVITETIFAWPGLGRLMIQAVMNRDFPLVQGAVFVVASIFIILNLLIDLSYTLLDPQVRFS